MDYSYLTSCEHITEDDFRSAVASNSNTQKFLRQIEEISRPGFGVGKIVFFFARLALRNKELEGTAKHIYQDLALQITRSRRNHTLFEIRFMHDVGGIYEQLYKVTVWCDFAELLQAARDSEDMKPFVCVDAHEDYLLLEATGAERMNSLAPPAYAEADARYRELESAGMLSAKDFPTIPPPDEGPDPHELFSDAMGGAVISCQDYAISKPKDEDYEAILLTEDADAFAEPPPSGILHAIVKPNETTPFRERFDSWADEAKELAKKEPSLPSEPLDRNSITDNDMAQIIGRISLTQVPASDADQLKPNHSLRNRPETQRPPGIDSEEDSSADFKTQTSPKDTDPKDCDDGWDDLLPIVHPKEKK